MCKACLPTTPHFCATDAPCLLMIFNILKETLQLVLIIINQQAKTNTENKANN